MEDVGLLTGDFVAGNFVIADVFKGDLLGSVGVLLDNLEGSIGDYLAQFLADPRDVLVDVSSVDGLQQELQHLDYFQQDEDLLAFLIGLL
jgi:hypothetical protein